MKKLILLTAVLPFKAAGFTQEPPKAELFGGYSFLRIDTQGVTGKSLDTLCNVYLPGACPSGTFKVQPNFNGWAGAAQFNLNTWLGVKADISGHYGTPLTVSSTAQSVISGLGVTGFPPKATSYSFLFGPVGRKRYGRYTPFAHALFGINQISTSTITVPAIPPLLPTGTSLSKSDSAFAMAFGAGVDWEIGNRFRLRLVQADFLYTKHDFSFGLPGISNHQDNFKVSAGIVYVFGGQKETVEPGKAEHAAKRSGTTTMPIPILGLLVSNRESGEGAQIAEVIPGGGASFSGLRVGDVINAVDGKPVRSPMELAAALSDRASGTKVLLGVLIRGQWQSDTAVILGPPPTSK